jgi:hypothetical protein
MPVDPELQAMYDELKRRNLFKSDPEMQAMGHEFRKRGLVADATQGGLVKVGESADAAQQVKPRLSSPNIGVGTGPQQANVGVPAPKANTGNPPPSLMQHVGHGLDVGMRILSRPANAMNAATSEWSRGFGDTADQPLMSAIPQVATRAINAGVDTLFGPLNQPDVPPTAVRNAFNLQPGKSGRLAYNVGAIADYLLGAITDPSNFVAPEASLAKTLGKVPGIKQGVQVAERIGQAAAKTRPVAAAVNVGRKAEHWATRQLAEKTGNIVTEAVGLQKQLFLSQPSTQVTNLMSNVAASELALTRNGVAAARLVPAYGSAAKEAVQYAATKVPSADIAELSHYIPDFGNSLNRSLTQQAGLSAKIGRYNPAMIAQGATEEAGKLALFKALKAGGLSPAEAAAQVQKHLFDYSDRPALLQLADTYGLWVFNAFGSKAVHLFADTLVHRPDLVARYPRLKRMLMEDVPGAKEGYQNLPDYAKGPLTLPIGGNRFVDVGRTNPFTQSLGITSPEEGNPLQQPNLIERALSPTIASSLPRMLRNVPRDAPVEDQVRAALREIITNSLPVTRSTGVPGLFPGRVGAAVEGRAISHTAEPQSVKQAVLQSLTGLNVYRGETETAKQERLAPAVQVRNDAAERYISELEKDLAAGRITNPFNVDSVTNERVLAGKLKGAMGYMRKIGNSPQFINKQGQISEEGKAAIRRAYLFTAAIGNRLDKVQQ